MYRLITRSKYIINQFFIALKGTETNFTSGGINKAIFMLSVPMILEMVMESLFAVVDVFFVGKVSTNAVATVGLTESVLTIIYSVAIGLSMATTAIIARRVGEKNIKRAGDTAFQAMIFSGSVSLFLGLGGLLYAEEILRFMGGSDAIIYEGINYTKIMFAGNISIMFLFLINSIFRGAGNASLAMRSLWLANGCNIILDPIFIFGFGPIPAFGVEGAAIATTIGRFIGVAFQLFALLRGFSLVRVTRGNIVLRLNTIVNLIKISAGGIGQFLIESASWIFLVRIISLFGSEALAGYTITIRVIVFTLLPSWGMSNAAATLVGQNLGALNPSRAEKSVWLTAWYNVIFLALISILFYSAADSIIGIFTQDTQTKAYGVDGLKIICLGYIFFAFGMVMSQSFNGAGDTRTPTIVNFLVFWIIQIPMAYFLAVYFELEAKGVYITIAIAHSLHAIISTYLFRLGRWKLTKV
ncbi:MAG TPA: MATE family efflux transporter [Cyclobacteriaceae bacterium]